MNRAYTLNADDALAMNTYFNQKFPPIMKQMRLYRILYASILGVFIVIFAYIFQGGREVPLFIFALALGCGIVAYVLFPLCQNVMIRINTNGAIKRGKYHGFLGDQTIIATSEHLVIQSPMGEGKYNWQAFIHKGQSPQHIFLFPNTASAIVIPKRVFSDATELQEFLKLTDGMEENQANKVH